MAHTSIDRSPHSSIERCERPSRPSITLLIPCFQEEEIIERSYARLARSIDDIDADWRFLFVDDGSTDATWEILKRLQDGDQRVALLRLSRNFGHQNAITAGLDRMEGDAVFIFDADLQDPPELIPEFLERWKQGFDVVYGRRSRRNDEYFVRRLATSMYYFCISWSSELGLVRQVADFSLMDKRVVDQLCQLREQDRYLRGLRQWVGFRQDAVEYVREGRIGGHSKYTWKKLFGLGFDGLFSFGNPLLLIIQAAGAGLLLVILLMALAGLSILSAQVVVGVVAALWGALVFLLLCLVTDYLRRIHRDIKSRPLYIIDCFLPAEDRAFCHLLEDDFRAAHDEPQRRPMANPVGK